MTILAVTSNLDINLYLINQIIDIFLWMWVGAITYKRVICRGQHSDIKFKGLLRNWSYIADILLFLASLIAICKFSDQFHQHIVDTIFDNNLLSRTIPWMVFHKLIIASILIRYRNSQPQIFGIIINEIKRIIWKKDKKLLKT